MGGRGSGSGGGGGRMQIGGGGGGSSEDSDKYKTYQKNVDADMKKVDAILNSGKNKADILKDLKGIGYILDSNVKRGDIRSVAGNLVKRRHTPNIWKK